MTADNKTSLPGFRPSANGLQLFALEATAEFGVAVAQKLGLPLAPHEERGFEDGEHKVRPLTFTAAQTRAPMTSSADFFFSSAP